MRAALPLNRYQASITCNQDPCNARYIHAELTVKNSHSPNYDNSFKQVVSLLIIREEANAYILFYGKNMPMVFEISGKADVRDQTLR